MKPASSNTQRGNATPHAVVQQTSAAPPILTDEEQRRLDEMMAVELNSASIYEVATFARAFSRPEHPQVRELVRKVFDIDFKLVQAMEISGPPLLMDSGNLIEAIQDLVHEPAAASRRGALLKAIEIIDHHLKHNPRQEYVPLLIGMVADAACRDKESIKPAIRCMRLLDRIEDAGLKRATALPLGHSLLASIQKAPFQVISQSRPLEPLLDAITACGEDGKILLGEVLRLVSAAVGEVQRMRHEPMDMWTRLELTEVLKHSAIPDDFKKRIAIDLVNEFEQTQNGLTGVFACVPYLQDTHKEQVFWKIIRSGGLDEDSLLMLATAIKSIERAQTRQGLQVALAPQLAAAASSLKVQYFPHAPDLMLRLYGALTEINGGSPELIGEILSVVPRCHLESLDLAAVLTFQLDPQNKVMRPDTERRAVENELNPDQLVGGTPFQYPPEIAKRRSILQDAASTGITGRLAHMISPIPLNVMGVAQITETYAGHPVQPSDWPRLLELLAHARP